MRKAGRPVAAGAVPSDRGAHQAATLFGRSVAARTSSACLGRDGTQQTPRARAQTAHMAGAALSAICSIEYYEYREYQYILSCEVETIYR